MWLLRSDVASERHVTSPSRIMTSPSSRAGEWREALFGGSVFECQQLPWVSSIGWKTSETRWRLLLQKYHKLVSIYSANSVWCTIKIEKNIFAKVGLLNSIKELWSILLFEPVLQTFVRRPATTCRTSNSRSASAHSSQNTSANSSPTHRLHTSKTR